MPSALGSGWRSASARPGWLPTSAPPPKWIAQARTQQQYEHREQIANAVGKAVQVSVANACELTEKALPLIAKLEPDQAEAIFNRVAHKQAAYELRALSSSASLVFSRRHEDCRELARVLAQSLVKQSGPLRETVEHLLENPPRREAISSE